MDYRNSSRDEGSSRDSSLGPSEPENTVEEPRRKNLDRRRETSRYAARDRRGKEADIFVDLKDVVPVVEETTVTHVDRIALLRVASTMCRMRRNAARFLETELPPEDPEVNVFTEQTLTECMDGFVLLADSDGTILYVSESVSVFLGLTQTDLVGRFLNEFVHAQDYDELIRLSTTDCDGDEASTLDDFGRYLVVRMKTVISPRGRNLNLKSALYKAILCRFRAVTTEYGRLSLFYGSSTPAGQGNSVMLANASVKGSETTNGVYMTRHTCDMRFSYVSDSLNFLLRHEARSLMGSSFYDLVHPSDVHTVAQSMRELFKKGHCRTAFYRLLGANSSVAWVQTEATTVNHTARGQKGQYVLCVHSILGMQSEAESWSDPVIDEQLAANPAYCTSQIKREIPDMAEYMGRQPEFIECVDFTPLIDPIADVNFAEFNSANSSINQRSSAKARNDQQVPQSKQRRKKSFDQVLDWLVRDEADSPPPPFNQEFCYGQSTNRDGFFDTLQTNESNAATGGQYSFRRFNTFENNFPPPQPNGSYNYNQPQYANQTSTLDFNPEPQSLPANVQQSSWNGVKTLANFDSTSTASMAGRNDSHRGTAATAHYDRRLPTNTSDVERCRNGGVVGSLLHTGKPIETKATGDNGQRYSRYDVHQRQTNFQQQDPNDQGNDRGTAVNRPRSTGTGNVSTIPSNAGYLVSTFNVENTGKSRPGANPVVYSAMSSARFAKKTARSRDSSRNSQRSTDSSIQYIGEFNANGQPINGLHNRSRSGSATSTGSNGYGNSAARRYAKASPSPQSLRFSIDRRRSTEPREQRALNVNHLNSVKLRTMESSPQSYNQNSNFYYAARKSSTPNQQPSNRSTVSPHKRSAHPFNTFDSYNGNQFEDTCEAPTKRMAYGNEIPQSLISEFEGQKRQRFLLQRSDTFGSVCFE
ncbi:hypothetical protein M3Y94_00410500 [Aphelenchoides besseyi]|nr:hypothetical protein M3Y94_00410500 [Aphelenchoides besseyi]